MREESPHRKNNWCHYASTQQTKDKKQKRRNKNNFIHKSTKRQVEMLKSQQKKKILPKNINRNKKERKN